MRPLKQEEITRRYESWLDLLDFSARLAMAGMKAQGLSRTEAWQTWRRRWARASAEHQRANHKVAQWLHLHDHVPTQKH